jgi:hypothetical protein
MAKEPITRILKLCSGCDELPCSCLTFLLDMIGIVWPPWALEPEECCNFPMLAQVKMVA